VNDSGAAKIWDGRELKVGDNTNRGTILLLGIRHHSLERGFYRKIDTTEGSFFEDELTCVP